MGKISYAGRLDPQMAAALQKQAELAPGIGEMNKLSLEEMRQLYIQERQYWNADAPDVQQLRDAAIPGPVGDIPIDQTEHPPGCQRGGHRDCRDWRYNR